MESYSESLFGFNSDSHGTAGMTRIPRQKRAQATVDAIIEAGFIAMAEAGPAGATTNRIAELAGISVGSLYEYFRNKNDIYAAMQQRAVADTVAALSPLLNTVVQMELREAVIALLLRFESFLRERDGRYLKYAQQTLQVGPGLKLEPLMQMLQELVLRYALRHPHALPASGLAAMSYILINGGVFTVLRHLSDPNPPISFAELAQGLADMVSRYAETAAPAAKT